MSDLMPTCPRCGDLGAPLARVCDECGHYLYECDAHRDMGIRMAYARRYRHPQSYPQAVDENLLDRALSDRLPSSVVTVGRFTSEDVFPAKGTGA